MTLGEAAKAGIVNLRRDPWAPGNYIEITIANGGYGPWAKIHDPLVDNESLRYDGWEKPLPLCVWQMPSDGWEEYSEERCHSAQ